MNLRYGTVLFSKTLLNRFVHLFFSADSVRYMFFLNNPPGKNYLAIFTNGNFYLYIMPL